jgi:tRNA nucleotidyltransferase (CCA-adding enzyme)
VRLNPKDFGLLIDFFGGQRDIREKTIRVLHNLSYVEDPTRAFRAIRFAERFGFKLSRHTENLIKSAIQMDLFDRLSGSRLYDELVIAFHETNPVQIVKRFSDFGLLKVIHPALAYGEKLETILLSMNETLAWYNLLYLEERADTGVLYLMALLSHLTDVQREEALTRLSAPPRTREVILRSIPRSAEILRRLPLRDPAAIYHHLSDAPIETLLFSMAATRDEKKKKEISQFLVELRKVKPLLKGRDLKRLGMPEGPLYSKVLRELLDERLRGRLRTEDDEKKYLLSHYPAVIKKEETRS